LNLDEFISILKYLQDEKRVLGEGEKFSITQILPAGWAHLEKLHQERVQSKQGFIAMDFSKELDPFFEQVLVPAIEAARYAPLRVDRKDHGDRIDDYIEFQIKNSRFMVADFTKNNKNVYFEAGYALGMDIPVIWTCKKGSVRQMKFDIEHFNQLRWDGPDYLPENKEEFIRKLTARIENICGPGPEKPKEK
jgi:hypothetical protein